MDFKQNKTVMHWALYCQCESHVHACLLQVQKLRVAENSATTPIIMCLKLTETFRFKSTNYYLRTLYPLLTLSTMCDFCCCMCLSLSVSLFSGGDNVHVQNCLL